MSLCGCGLNLHIWQNRWNHEQGCSMHPKPGPALSPAAWDHPKVMALAKAFSEAEMFYDDRDWLVLAEVALVHLGLMEWVTETALAKKQP